MPFCRQGGETAPKAFLRSLVLIAGLWLPQTASSDPLVEFLFWDSLGDTASQGVRSYQELQAERSLWKSEASRLRQQLDKCDGCDRAGIQKRLNYWEQTERDFQAITGGILSSMGYDANVQRFFGVDSPVAPPALALQATGQKDHIDFESLPDPAWLAEAGEYCQAIFKNTRQCLVAWQDQGRRPSNMCGNLTRLEEYCAAGDVAGAYDFTNILNLRLAGYAIPEVTDLGWIVTIDYGATTADVLPQVPSGRDMFDYMMAHRERKDIFYQLDRGTQNELLRRAHYGRFHPRDFSDYSKACPGYADKNRKDPPACKGLLEYRHSLKEGRYIAPPVLTCDYANGTEGTVAREQFWLHTRPHFALSAASVSPTIANLPVAGFCPPSYRQARALSRGRVTAQAIQAMDYTISMKEAGLAPEDPFDLDVDQDAIASRLEQLSSSAEVDLSTLEQAGQARRAALASRQEALMQPDVSPQAEQPKTQSTPEPRPTPSSPTVGGYDRMKDIDMNVDAPETSTEQMDIVGLKLGLSRPEAIAQVKAFMGPLEGILEREMQEANRDRLYRTSIHFRDDAGQEIGLYFDGPGEDATVIGIFRVLREDDYSNTGLRISILNKAKEKYAPWLATIPDDSEQLVAGSAVDDLYCRPGFPSFKGIADGDAVAEWIERSDTIDRRAFQYGMSVRTRPGAEERYPQCGPSLFIRFTSRAMLTGLIHNKLAFEAFREAMEKVPERSLPDL